MEHDPNAIWTLNDAVATCGGPDWVWSTNVEQPDAGLLLRDLRGNQPSGPEPILRAFRLSVAGHSRGVGQRLCLRDVFVRGECLFARYEEVAEAESSRGLEVHLALTVKRLDAAGTLGNASQRPKGNDHAEEYALTAVVSVRTECLDLQREVRMGFDGLAKAVTWGQVALNEEGQRASTVPLTASQATILGQTAAREVTSFSFPVIEVAGRPSAVGLLVHPSGIRPLKLAERTPSLAFEYQNDRFSAAYRLFPLSLEKGVVVRSMFQLILIREAGAAQRLAEMAGGFLTAAPPLSEE